MEREVKGEGGGGRRRINACREVSKINSVYAS